MLKVYLHVIMALQPFHRLKCDGYTERNGEVEKKVPKEHICWTDLPLTNSISIQQISRSVPCNKEAPTNNVCFESVPFCLEYKEHLTNSISIQQISRSAPCDNIPFEQISRSVPFCIEYKGPGTNSISIQQISRSVPCNKEAQTNNVSV
jgi:hypothetical protein